MFECLCLCVCVCAFTRAWNRGDMYELEGEKTFHCACVCVCVCVRGYMCTCMYVMCVCARTRTRVCVFARVRAVGELLMDWRGRDTCD